MLLDNIKQVIAMGVLDLLATRKRYPGAVYFQKCVAICQFDIKAVSRDGKHLFSENYRLWLLRDELVEYGDRLDHRSEIMVTHETHDDWWDL